MPIAMTQEQQALQVSLRDWAKRADTIAVVRAQADPAALMADLTALGVFAIPADGTVTDLAAALGSANMNALVIASVSSGSRCMVLVTRDST